MNIFHNILVYNKQVRIYIMDGKEMTQTAVDLHESSNVASAAIGRVLIGTSLMAQMLKDKNEEILVTVDGEFNKIIAVSNYLNESSISIKNPKIKTFYRSDKKLDVSKSIGPGILKVQRFYNKKEIWNSQVDLQNSEIAEDLAYYFSISEQTPSAVYLGVLIDKKTSKILQSAGFIIQLLPNTSDEIITEIEEKLKNFSLTFELENDKSFFDIVSIFDENYEVLETKEIKYQCSCSFEKIKKALISLGKDEIQSMIIEKHYQINCNFCNKEYIFNEQDLRNIQKHF